MTLNSVLPIVQQLSLLEKLQLIGLLVEDLKQPITEVQEEASALLTPKQAYPIYSPYAAYGAADVLVKVLENPEKYDVQVP